MIDRHCAPGLETSFANAGQISYGYSAPWAAPGLPLKAVKWLLTKHSPLAIRPDGTLWQLQWILLMLRNCTRQRYALNKGRMVALAEYSRACLNELRDAIKLDYEGRQGGTLQVFRTHKQYEDSARDVAVLEDCGLSYELLDAAGCIQAERGLGPVKHKIVGGLRLPGDETGDCHLFTTRLAETAATLGVRFLLGSEIENLRVDGNRLQRGCKRRMLEGGSLRHGVRKRFTSTSQEN